MIDRILPHLVGLKYESLLEQELHAASTEWIHAFVLEVDQSPYSLSEWVKAHDLFVDWTKERKRPIPLRKRQEYLICCIEGMKDPAGSLSLSSVLEYFLKQNGVD